MLVLSEPKRQRFVAFSCPHSPLHDDAAVEWLVKLIGQHKPNLIVHLGDGHEADSASRWPSEYTWSLSDEFRAHNELLVKIRRAWPQARRVFLPGNHDDNLLALNRIDPRLRDLCDYRRQPELEPELMKNWRQPIDYEFSHRGVYRAGQITFAHGYKHGTGSDEIQSLMLGMPYGLFVSGHTHAPVEVSQAKKASVDLPYWFANAGCIRDIWNVPYMARKNRAKWGQAAVIGDYYPVKSPRMSRAWDAETVIFRMFDPEAAR